MDTEKVCHAPEDRTKCKGPYWKLGTTLVCDAHRTVFAKKKDSVELEGWEEQ